MSLLCRWHAALSVIQTRMLAQEQSISTLEACVDYICGWMLQNKLVLNDNKTELLIIGTSKQISKLNVNGVVVGDSVVKPWSINAINRGVHFDAQLNMEKHITNVCKSAYHMLYNLRHIRKYLDQDSTKTVVHACITSKLDYCKLQRVIVRTPWLSNRTTAVGPKHLCKADLWLLQIFTYHPSFEKSALASSASKNII